MTRAVMRTIRGAATLALAIVALPLGAQMLSDGYEFLKAVKDRDGEAVTQKLNEPGSTLVNTRDKVTGETSLHIVTERRDTVWIRFLTQNGANPNIKDKNGQSPLQLAVRLGFVEGVEALLDAGADLEVSDVTGETPLIAAVHRRDTGLIRVLLAKGANPDRNDNSGRSARDYVRLAIGNSAMLTEFERADERSKSAPKQQNYGPAL